MGNPKARKGHGFGALVVGERRRGVGSRFYAQTWVINGESAGDLLKRHRAFNKIDGVINNGVIHIISDLQILQLAYEEIKSNPGQLTRGSSDETLDGISLEWFGQISVELRAGRFKFAPARRSYIPKPGKKEKRPLTISSPRDKVVQKAMHLVLEPIFEPHFFENSHGFRPSRGCHTALKQIKKWFHGVTWVIESDIAKCFDTVEHKVLLDLMRKRISCDKTLALVKGMLRAGMLGMGVFSETKLGTPQGSILSPLLCNIYLHELDRFMFDLKWSFSSPLNTKRRKNPDYRKLQYRISICKDPVRKAMLIKNLKLHTSKDPMDPNFRRLFYVRYADDFVVGVTASYKEVESIKDQLQLFLNKELKMDLSPAKTTITHFKKRSIKFLGTIVYGISRKEKPMQTQKRPQWNTSIKVRITPRPGLHAPIKDLLAKLCKNGFVKKDSSGKYKPTALRRMTNFDHADIVGYYSSIARGLLNYYSFADNYTRVGALVKYHLRSSCALTLALKYKLRYQAKAFANFGSTLKCPTTEKEFSIPKSFKRKQEFKINPPAIEEALVKKWNKKLTRTNLGKACVICGDMPAEMHHVRKIRDLKAKYRKGKLDFFRVQMAAFNRKQVPLCRIHHITLHKGALTETERIAFRKGLEELN
jgi:group II intron reverse transcriptase/maturase